MDYFRGLEVREFHYPRALALCAVCCHFQLGTSRVVPLTSLQLLCIYAPCNRANYSPRPHFVSSTTENVILSPGGFPMNAY